MEEGRGLLSISSSSSEEVSVPSEEAGAAGADRNHRTHRTQRGFLEKLSVVCPLLADCGSKGAQALQSSGDKGTHHKPPLCLSLAAPWGGLQHWNSVGACSRLSLSPRSSKLQIPKQSKEPLGNRRFHEADRLFSGERTSCRAHQDRLLRRPGTFGIDSQETWKC